MTPRTRASRARSAAALGVVGALLLSGCGSIYDVPLPGGAKVGSNPITVHAEFRDVLDLVPQSTVKINDVTVGKVASIKLKGYTADVTLTLPRSVDLPDNARASIRQTSLLGEKFVSLAPPGVDPSTNKLGNGDVIPLSRTGRNPEVEEVLGALSLLLNGGGVGQLKTIASELNDTLGGREDDVRSVLNQLNLFIGQLNRNKATIVGAIEGLNRLAVQLRKQEGSIKLALDDLPAAIKSVNSQRADLVKTLQALQKLSGVGVRVIRESKAATIGSLKDLSPVLDKIADAGANFADSIQVALTYPFIDAAVGRDPQAARNLHMGDYVNLDARLNLDLTDPGSSLPIKVPPVTVPPLARSVCQLTTKIKQQAVDEAQQVVGAITTLTGAQQTKVVKDVLDSVNALDCNDPLNQQVLNKLLSNALGDLLNLSPVGDTVKKLLDGAVKQLNGTVGGTLGGLTGGGTKGGSGSGSGGLLGSGSGSGGGLLGLGRTATGFDAGRKGDPLNGPAGDVAKLGYNSTLGALLLQGVTG